MTKAEQRALEAYPYFPTEVNLFGHKTITADGNSHYRSIFIKGYEQAEKDISALIESRISEILGDAQPKSILRAELQELIKRIKEEQNDGNGTVHP